MLRSKGRRVLDLLRKDVRGAPYGVDGRIWNTPRVLPLGVRTDDEESFACVCVYFRPGAARPLRSQWWTGPGELNYPERG